MSKITAPLRALAKRSIALLLAATLGLGALLLAPSRVAADGGGDAPTVNTAESTTAAPQSTGESPKDVVERFHAGLLEIMKHAHDLGFQGRIDVLDPLMQKTFDLEFMASKTVGRHWRKLSPADQARWIELFRRLTTANYAGRFTGFKGEKFVFLGEEDAARGTRLVLTKIDVPDDDDVELNYRLLKTDRGWRIVDVYLNGTVSELALRRSEYSSAPNREGFEELVAAIETKIKDLKAKGRVDG